ncbi:polysaccharide export outer membrane protein [Oxalobacteraceae bacterium GrIS 2.11]
MKQLASWIIASILGCMFMVAHANDILIGPGDTLKISVYNNNDLGLTTRVSETGNITFPLIGEVKVGGLAVHTAEKRIGALLESGGFLKSAYVNIVVAEFQNQVSVLGSVTKPGRYALDGQRTVIDMLALAGGLTAEAGDTVRVIHSNGAQTTHDQIDIIDMMRSGDLSKNQYLGNNDVLYVEHAPHFFIYGELQHPGMYKLERSMTVIQALSVGGGLTVRGTDRGIKLKRRDAKGQMVMIDVKHDDPVTVDDVIYIQESLF